jgi:hypothetical protein
MTIIMPTMGPLGSGMLSFAPQIRSFLENSLFVNARSQKCHNLGHKSNAYLKIFLSLNVDPRLSTLHSNAPCHIVSALGRFENQQYFIG